jgi:hypothetical protein
MEELASRIAEVVHDGRIRTVRQVFYRLVSSGAIDKTEEQYRVVIRFLTDMRRDGRIGFEVIADNTRWALQPTSYPNPEAALHDLVHSYRRSRWDDQPVYVEVCLEKDALSHVLYEVTARFDVPLRVTRGYSSITFLKDAADMIAWKGKPAYLLCFGDFDPSGVDITRAVEDDIRRYAPNADVTVERVAVTEEQIKQWNLPTRPTKTSDVRAKNWGGESVELDAVPIQLLQDLVEERIRRHIDTEVWAATERKEQEDRNKLSSLLDGFTKPRKKSRRK